VRLLRKIIDETLDGVCFGGPGKGMPELHDFLRPALDSEDLYGFDVAECDSSHHADFVLLIEELLAELLPTIPPVLSATLRYMREEMREWRCVSRSGAVRASVEHQLASGSPWTFLLNCLWALFQLVTLLKGRPPIASISGDDGVVSGVKLPVGEVVTKWGVTLKMSHEPKAVLYCHHLFTPLGVFPHPVRTLSKFLCRDTPTVKELEQTKQAINDLYKVFRNTEVMGNCIAAYAKRLNLPASDFGVAFDLLFRLCNTSSSDLLKLTHTVVLHPMLE
jgi:hypothetical protein